MKIYNKVISIPLIVLGLILLIVFSVIKINLDQQAVFLCNAVEQDPNLTMEQCPAHQQSNSWYLFLGFGISIFTLLAGIFLLFFNFAKPKTEENKIDTTKLDPLEKKVVEFIKEREGSVYQSDLVKEFEWTKVKTTRILDKLENKKILERKRRGMTNLVVLK